MAYSVAFERQLELKVLLRAVARSILFGGFVLIVGCMRWNGVPLSSAPRGPSILRLHLREGRSIIVRDAVVRGDSIIGVRGGNASDGARVAVALVQVERVDVGKTDHLRTWVLAIGVFMGVWLALGLVALLALASEGT